MSNPTDDLRQGMMEMPAPHRDGLPEPDTVSDIVAFLLARIAEDEAADKRLPWGDAAPPSSFRFQVAEFTAARRRLGVEWWRAFPWRWLGRGWLAKMALPYADHPDYREEWRL